MGSAAGAAAPRVGPAAAFAITFIAYLLTARLGLLLAIQPGNASPLFPAAGVALAAVFVWGRPALAAVALAALGANLWLVWANEPIGARVLLTWVCIAAGSALQAALGAWLVRRFVTMPLLLSEPIDLARFMLGVVPVACLVSASVAVLTLLATGTITAPAAPGVWSAWWAGDTLGMLIGAPITWTLIGQPRDAWRPRRGSVALPLVCATAVMAFGIFESMRADQERQARAIQREAESAANAFTQRLQAPLAALEAMHGLVEAVPAIDRTTFGRAAAPWTATARTDLAALGYLEWVERSALAAFEARQHAAGISGFRVVERWAAGVQPPAADPLAVIRLIEPAASNAGALGVNPRSMPDPRAAIDAASRQGRPVATPSFALSQGGVGVVVYQPVYEAEATTPERRRSQLRGLVFATLRPQALLAGIAARMPPTLAACLIDLGAAPGPAVLAGAPGCDAAPASLHQVATAVPFAGRRWELRIDVAPGARGGRGIGRTWPLALVSLTAAALLGALLLIITGRARRIESEVAQRTLELEQRTTELQTEAQQRQHTASALRDSQQRLRNILNHVPIGVAYTDTAARIREANPRLRGMLGIAGERLSGRVLTDWLHPDDQAAEANVRARLLDGELPMAHWQLRCVGAGGNPFAARASVSVLRTSRQEARRLVWVIEDITEHLALQDAMRAREGAEASNRAKSEFLSRMSHELRTPLNAMLGFTQLLELDSKLPLAPHQLEWTAQMRQAGWHLLHMINDTLDLSRIESGHVDLEPRAIDLQELAESAHALLEQRAREEGVAIELHLGAGARAVIGDATRVRQILTNLLSNAVKYNSEGGQVIVSSRLADDGRVALDVIDTGAGMSPAQLAQLFQPFNRLGRESGPIEGTGIGLVISLRLAELMGGTLHARSTQGLGSTFTLELPRAASEPTPALPDEGSDLEPASYRRRLIVYVEDNETNAEVMRGIVALRPQVDLEVAMLGLDGLALIRRKRPSLVLLDMQLPDIDGLELLRHLQAAPDTADIPVIVVSADATAHRVDEALAAGAMRYLLKPVNVPQFLAAVDEVLEEMDTHFG